MAINRIAQIGGDAFAKPTDHVEARRGGQTERNRHREQRNEVFAQRHHLRALVVLHQAAVNQASQSQGKGQCRQCRQQQEHPGQGDAQTVGAQEGQQARE